MFIIAIFSIVVTSAGLALQSLAYYIPSPFSRRRIEYECNESVPVINEQARKTGLSVTYGGNVMVDPHVIQLSLNTGKRDIPTRVFDQGTPLRFEFGVKIIAILHTSYRPANLAIPDVAFSEQVLSIGPNLIRPRSFLEYVLLVDGPCTEVLCRPALEEVDVKERKSKDKVTRIDISSRSVLGWATIAFIIFYALKDPGGAAHILHSISAFLSGFASTI